MVEYEAAPRVTRGSDPGLGGAEGPGPEQRIDLEVGGALEKERVCRSIGAKAASGELYEQPTSCLMF